MLPKDIQQFPCHDVKTIQIRVLQFPNKVRRPMSVRSQNKVVQIKNPPDHSGGFCLG
jgi:hypothetical protein